MFVYHEYINPNHYQSPPALCEDLSSQVTDIIRKLHTEALNLLNMELYARNMLIPGPEYIITSDCGVSTFCLCWYYRQAFLFKTSSN